MVLQIPEGRKDKTVKSIRILFDIQFSYQSNLMILNVLMENTLCGIIKAKSSLDEKLM